MNKKKHTTQMLQMEQWWALAGLWFWQRKHIGAFLLWNGGFGDRIRKFKNAWIGLPGFSRQALWKW